MSKKNRNALKSQPVVAHTANPTLPASPEGHVVYPELIKPQSGLETLSRTVRSLIPSFATSSSPNPPSATLRPASQRSYGSYASTADPSPVPDDSTPTNAVGWSRWSSIQNKYLLLVAYQSAGFHIWDFTQLDAVKEVLHLPSIGPVVSATLIAPRNHPTLLLLCGSGEDATLNVYSLRSHTFLKRIGIPNACSVQANTRFIAVGVQSTSPTSPAIHILAASGDYVHLYVVPSSSVSPYTVTSPIFSLSSSRLLAYASSEPPAHLQSPQTPPSSYPPSNPFTALASPGATPASNLATGLSVVGSTMLTGAMRLGTGVLEGVKLGINAAGYGAEDAGKREDARGSVSRSAPPVHSSPLASRGHARRASAQIRSAISGPGGAASPGDGGEWITVLDLQPLLSASVSTEEAPKLQTPLSPSSSFLATSPPLTYLSIPPDTTQTPEVVVEFPYVKSGKSESTPPSRASPSKFYGLTSTTSRLHSSLPTTVSKKAITSLAWSPDGALLAVGGEDGGSVRVFKLPRSRRGKDADDKLRINRRLGKATLVYELLRGVTPASIHDISWSADGLWNGFVSSNGTLHAFSVHPQSGEPDGASQVYGRVLNSTSRAVASVRLRPLARLRQPFFGDEQEAGSNARSQPPQQNLSPDPSGNEDQPSTPPTFAFLPVTISRKSARLPSAPEPSSLPNTLPSGGLGTEEKVKGFNDVLVFLPDEGRVVVWRNTLHIAASPTPANTSPASRRIEPSPSIVGDAPVPNATTSGLPSSLPSTAGVISGVARMVGLGEGGFTGNRGGLVSQAAVLASWDIARGDSWPDVKSAWDEKPAATGEAPRRS
ncbi:hypothetical protein M408DRAFT_28737 [Serendipita vermifera MAFF 305830]|uniref:Uncharacterized protein n=1 Tax=Serendipita vermifera MAFF 305830 TaxID=933852 RepID=A0A0C3ACP9_SERVB|nr:hypothetical protein M408DRAFT_28737 [Serendipita vermifera MAFF 305830]